MSAAMIEARSFWELVELRAARSPEAVMAFEASGRSLTFGGYRASAERVAAGLAARGVAPGAAVSWELPTWIDSLVLAAALSRLGAVQNPVIPIYRARELGFVVHQTGARLVVVPPVWRGFDYPAMAAALAAETAGLDVLVCDRCLPEGDPASLPPAPPAPDDPGEAAVGWRFYTSGTTADPKGAQHTDRSVMAAARAMILALELGPDDVHPLVFPLAHIGGIVWLFSSLMTGCRQLVVEGFDASETIALMAESGVTLAGSVTPIHMAYLAAQRAAPDRRLLPCVRAFPGGAAPKPPQLHHDLKAELGGVGIVSGYGLTECPILSMNTVRDPDEKLAETEGRPAPGVSVKVVTGAGRAAAPAEEGEIRVRGPQLFRGYLDAGLDADAFDEDGYLRTGDLGFRDADGYLVITGRLKDVIVRKGENISAKELEDLLYAHPKVGDVAVIGIPDEAVGERCCAVVAPSDLGDPITFEEMTAFLRQRDLMVQKLPERLEIVEQVPRNPSGKIQKDRLRAQLAGGQAR